MSPASQVAVLFILSIPVACVAWTITHEEVFREFRNACLRGSKTCRTIYERKFFYLFTCEYCFSHYVAAFFLILTGFKLLLPGWRGYLIAWFSLVWVANVYISLFARLRLNIKKERVQITAEEAMAEGQKQNLKSWSRGPELNRRPVDYEKSGNTPSRSF